MEWKCVGDRADTSAGERREPRSPSRNWRGARRKITQLGFEIIGLLARKPRDRVIAVKALPGLAVADLAIFDLGLNAAGTLARPRQTPSRMS